MVQPLGQRFYASRAYKQVKPGVVLITGEKFAGQIIKYDLEFTPLSPPKPDAHQENPDVRD